MNVPLSTDDLVEEIIVDLLRSGWIVERARAALYGSWAAHEPSYERARDRTLRRAEIVGTGLEARGGRPDADLVEPHTAWMASLVGDRPDAVPLGNLLIPRLGDWVENHVPPFLDGGGDEITALGDEERSELTFPENFPAPPPFEPVSPVELDPPGEVRFRFGILADLHFGFQRGEAMARAAIDDLNASGSELVIQLGDLTDHGNREEFELATKTLARLEMPLATMIGNHDVFSLKEERLAGRDYYPASFGRDPDGVILEHRGFRFAVLDSAEHGASPFPSFDFASGSFIGKQGGAIVRGSLTVPQHEILADVAAPGAPPAFVFLHHPPQPFTGFPPVLFGLRDADSGRLHAVADSGNVWGIFAGHTHRNARTRTYGNVPAHEVAIPKDFPFGYAVVDVADGGYVFRFVQLSDRELLRDGYQAAGEVFRRYGLGPEVARGFVWTKP